MWEDSHTTMPFLIAPILTTSALKIPLLLSYTVCAYHGLTPPTKAAPPKAIEKFNKPDVLSKTMHIQLASMASVKYLLLGTAVAETVLLLAQQFPSTKISAEISTYLFPSRSPASLRLTTLSLTGCLLGTVGGALRIWCHRTLGRHFTWQVAIVDDHRLVTAGPYATVRHPGYTAWTALVVGTFMYILSPGSYFVESGMWDHVLGKAAVATAVTYMSWVTCALLSRVPKEDQVLQREYGAQWEEWAKKTPYRLIPYVY